MSEISLESSGPAPLPPKQSIIQVAAPTPIKLETNIVTPTPLPTPPTTPCPTKPFYTIPDFVSYSPYKLSVNRHYQPVGLISEHWLNSYGVHPSAKKRAAFEACNMGLLTAMCNPNSGNEWFRVQCDFINALFAWDDLTDEGGLRMDGKGTNRAADIIMNTLHHPFTYDTPFRCGKVFASLYSRAIELGCAEGLQTRFLEYTNLYMQAVHEQVLNRAADHIPGVEEWIKLRRDTGALKMCFMFGAFGLKLDLPDEVLDHPLIRVLENCSNDIVVLSNDIYSFNIEQAQGDTCNIIEVAMKQYRFDIQGAMDYAGELVKSRIDLYTATKAKLPSWGPQIDAQVALYMTVLEDWLTAGFYWSLESERYFGKSVHQVRRTLRVELLPKEAPRGQMEIPGFCNSSQPSLDVLTASS